VTEFLVILDEQTDQYNAEVQGNFHETPW